MYITLKIIHASCALFSVSLFAWRWQLALKNSPLLQARWLRLLPRVVDSLLIGAALALVMWSAKYPFSTPWVTAKFVGLLLYILLGTLAIKSWRLSMRRGAGVAALATAVYIISVAISKDPRGIFLALE